MSFISSFIGFRQIRLEGEGVYLRLLEMSDFEDWVALRQQSQDFLQPWEPIWATDELTKNSFRRRIKFYRREMVMGGSYCFAVFDAKSNQLVGGLNMTQIRQGVTKSCTIGYWIGAPYGGRGYMTKSVHLVCNYAFKVMKLHRVEAATLLDNEASIKLLRKTGFHFEGLAREFLKINGRWQDHFLFAKVRPVATAEKKE